MHRLFEFLSGHFSASEIRRIVRFEYPDLDSKLPSPGASRDEIVESFLRLLANHDLLNARLFDILRRERNTLSEEISRIERLLQTAADLDNNETNSRTRQPGPLAQSDRVAREAQNTSTQTETLEGKKSQKNQKNLLGVMLLGVLLGSTPLLGLAGVVPLKALFRLVPEYCSWLVVSLSTVFTPALSLHLYKKRESAAYTVVAIGAFSIVLLVTLASIGVVTVPVGADEHASFILGFGPRLSSCACDATMTDSVCIKHLTLDPSILEMCWSKGQITLGIILIVTLSTTSLVSIGAFICNTTYKTLLAVARTARP